MDPPLAPSHPQQSHLTRKRKWKSTVNIKTHNGQWEILDTKEGNWIHIRKKFKDKYTPRNNGGGRIC